MRLTRIGNESSLNIYTVYLTLFSNQVLEGYGQTETTAAATIQMIGDQTYGEKNKIVEIHIVHYQLIISESCGTILCEFCGVIAVDQLLESESR